MSATIEYQLNKASAAEIAEHLSRCDDDFAPPLSSRVEIKDYAGKIAGQATRFEAWSGGMLVGLVAAYCNDRENRIAYITSVSLLTEWTGKGVATHLLKLCIEHAKEAGMRQINLEAASNNISALKLYKKSGFGADKVDTSCVTMSLYLESGEKHERQA